MNPLVRNILIIGTILILASLGGGLFLWVMPVEAQIAQLSSSLESEKNNRTRAEAALKQLEASTSVIREQLDQLALYDLREEVDPQSVLQTRSNSQLIMVSRILEDATVSVSDLNLVKSENIVIGATGSTPIASVQKQHFLLHGTALYRDFLHAFQRLQELPPTVALNNYSLRYLSKVGSQAKVDIDMDISFNFLMKPPAGAAAPGAAGGSANSAFEQMMKSLGNTGSFLPGIWRHAVLPATRAARQFRNWLDPPALAATGRLVRGPGGIRVVADGRVEFRTFRLSDGRVVVDMPGLTVTHKQAVKVGRGGVRSARLAQFSRRPLVGRLVVDTTRGQVRPVRVRNGVFVAIEGTEVAAEVAPPRAHRRFQEALPRGSRQDAGAPGIPVGAPGAPGTPVYIPPRVRATPMPADHVAPIAAARPAPAPQPEGDAAIRRVQVRPWQDGEIRRVQVQPDSRDIVVAVQWAPPQGMAAPGQVVPPPTSIGQGGPPPGGAPPAAAPAAPPPGAPPVGMPAVGGARPKAQTASGTGSVTAGRRSGGLSLPEIQIGRSEPFFPLIDATDDLGFKALAASDSLASGSATGSATGSLALASGSATPTPIPTPPVVIQAPVAPIALATPPPPTRLAVSLRGVLMGGSEATGLFEVNGQFMRARAGSSLGAGYTVRAIGRDFALVSSPFGTEKKELLRTWNPVVRKVAATPEPSPAAAPAPPTGAGPVSQIPLPNQVMTNSMQQR